LGVLVSVGRANTSSSGIWEPGGTESEGRLPLYEWNLKHKRNLVAAHLLCGLSTIANRSSRGNQSCCSLVTHNSTRRSHGCTVRLTCISNFHPLTASSVRIFVKEMVRPSRKKRWHGSLATAAQVTLTGSPSLQRVMAASRRTSSSPLASTGTTQRGRLIISSRRASSATGNSGSSEGASSDGA
ncbi:unnamed protein product, partial [Ixodes persulcatus]